MNRKTKLNKVQTISRCTGCGFIISPGAYFKKRIIRHLNDGKHNHDAVQHITSVKQVK